jgi:protocatechuate 3,4-dioxygenase beta subunit
MRVLALLCLSGTLLVAQQQTPARDAARTQRRVGTGAIRGQVVAADTGLPIRQAHVTLSPMQDVVESRSFTPTIRPGVPPGIAGGVGTTTLITAVRQVLAQSAPPIGPRSALTDSQGAFEFKELPAGSYRLFASTGQFAAQYLSFAYGAKRTNDDPGETIELAEGQAFDSATIALPRGAVIAGRVTDDTGEPMASVQVHGVWFPPRARRGQRRGFAQTDDLGQFRMWRLEPGEYAIGAEAQTPTFVPPNSTENENEQDRDGFLTTYYPGTADEASAQRVRTRLGTETVGVEIRMVRGRLYRLSGMVVDSHGAPLAHADGQLVWGTTGYNFSTDDQGRFRMRNLPAGSYRVIVQQHPPKLGPNRLVEGDQGETASVPLTLAGGDLENLIVVTSPGITITGHVEFEPGPPPYPVRGMRVGAVAGDPEMPRFGPLGASVERDLSFKLVGLNGEYLIRSVGDLPPNHYLKAVLVGGNDISDTPREFTSQDRVTVLVSSRGATLEGTVTDAKGTPTSDAGVILFPEDKASWRANGIRVRDASLDAHGRYRISPMHPGRYFILAAPRDRLITPPGTDFAAVYDQLSKDATMVVVSEDEMRTVDLKVIESSGGR